MRAATEQHIKECLELLKRQGLKVTLYPENNQINVTDVEGVIQTYCATNGRMLLRNKNGQDYHSLDNNYDPPYSYSIEAFMVVLMCPYLRRKAIEKQSVKPFKECGIKSYPLKKFWFT